MFKGFPPTSPFKTPIRLAVFVSGGGTTLANLLDCIRNKELSAEVGLVVASREHCGGVEKGRRAGIRTEVVRPKDFLGLEEFNQKIFDICRDEKIDLVVCGGFLCRLKIPADFALRVMNIHPSLIPAFCGQGFYGHLVHEAVIKSGVKLSGCTVHFVDDEYDHGPIILQRAVPVFDEDSAESLGGRVFQAECAAYPEAIRLYCQGRLRIREGRVIQTRSDTSSGRSTT